MKPVISDAEARALAIAMLPEGISHVEPHASDVHRAAEALSAFLAARMPDARCSTEETSDPWDAGHDYCRERVLGGKE